MNILHVMTDHTLENIASIIAEKKGFYQKITRAELATFDEPFERYHLIVLECDDITPECEQLITRIVKQSRKLTSIIMVTDIGDFWTTSSLFDKGIMTTMSKTHFDTRRFSAYLETLCRDLHTLEELRSMRIAVVDDSHFSLEVIKGYFDRYGVQNVDYYLDSTKLIQAGLDYDLFLVDLVMPNINGEDLIYEIREHNSYAIIIIITTYGEGNVIPHCLSIGANDFLLKPFDFKLFILRIQAAIQSNKLYIENQVNTVKLYEMATSDRLTGLYNRAFFIDSLNKQVEAFLNTHRPLSIILLDLDHFKKVNDEYGHQQGDRVLMQTAELLKSNTRASDIVCRWGGEEFCIIFPNTTLFDANQFAEKIRQRIETTHFNFSGHITASLGVTTWLLEDTEDSCFRRLDNSLYLAKLTGRNKVVSNEELVIAERDIPVAVEWGPFFRSGHKDIDREHQQLITISNEIISMCFLPEQQEKTLALFDALLEETIDHFRHEEEILEHMRYPKAKEHKNIHDQLLEQTKIMHSRLKDGRLTAIDVAKYVIQEVIVGHIIKSDFEYYEWLM